MVCVDWNVVSDFEKVHRLEDGEPLTNGRDTDCFETLGIEHA